MNDIAWMDATSQAELIRKRDISAAELLDLVIGHLEKLNPRLNAVVFPLYEQARRAVSAPLPAGPFTGVPFLLKNINAWMAGAPQDQGSAFLKGFVAPYDAELVRRYRQAGLVVCGITNAPEFGLMPTTEPTVHGPARNPWNTGHITGGSSGGAAAAVAAGIVPMAHANDGGGSIRIPAACCGVVGLKPTRARNPLGPGVGDIYNGLIADHAVTRSVRDAAALLDATAGPDIGDPYPAPVPERPFLEEVGRSPGRLRMAFSTAAPTGVPVHPDCVAAVHDVAALCADLGHEVTEAAPEFDPEKILRPFMTIWAAGLVWSIDGYARAMGREAAAEYFEPGTWALYQMGKRRAAADYLFAVQTLQRLARHIARFMVSYDVWLTPTLAQPPLPVGAMAGPPDNPLAGMRVAGAFSPFTSLCNVTGQPAISLPLNWNAAGLPIGTHFAARFGDEATLFRLAAQLEAARPWAQRHPPVCV
ncbi:MAG: amidase [Blastocatellia bacterium]